MNSFTANKNVESETSDYPWSATLKLSAYTVSK